MFYSLVKLNCSHKFDRQIIKDGAKMRERVCLLVLSPVIMLEMISGKMRSFSIRIKRSPGKDTSMMASADGLTALSPKPKMIPKITPTMVSTSSRLFRHHFNTLITYSVLGYLKAMIIHCIIFHKVLQSCLWVYESSLGCYLYNCLIWS